MNKNNLRPCLGGWLLITGGILRVFSPLFRFLLNGGILNGFRNLFRLLLNVVVGGLPLRYVNEILGYSFLHSIIYALPVFAVGIVLIMKKQSIPVAIACAVGPVVELVYPLLSQLFMRLFGLPNYAVFGFTSILNCLPYVLLALVALTAASQQPNGFKKLWWLPAAIHGVLEVFAMISSVINMIRNGGINFTNIVSIVLSLILGLVCTIGFFSAGQWLFDPYKKQTAYCPAPQTSQGNYYQPRYQQPATTNSVVQELERAKRLLDSGAINQEEYDVLKKRLLE